MSFLSVKEAAEVLGVSKQRIYQLIELGKISADRMGRTWMVDESSVQARSESKPQSGRPTRKGQSSIRSYTLMSKEYEILTFRYDESEGTFFDTSDVHDASRAPLGMLSPRGTSASGSALRSWWFHRSIPASRFHIDAKLKQLGLSDPYEIPFRSLGFSLSDQYWIRPVEHPDIRWADLNFFANDFGTLEADVDWLSDVGLASPDNTSEGMLPKRWICEPDGTRTLLKGSGVLGQEACNETVATALHKRLLSPEEYVPYHLVIRDGEAACASRCFVSSDEEYVPAFSVVKVLRQAKHHNDYQHYIECCAHLGISDVESFLAKMIVCDDLLANTDRHTRNFGIIRNVETLECRTAPLFDTGSCLWSMTSTEALAKGDYSFTTKPFKESPAHQLLLASDFSWLDLDALSGFEEEARELLSQGALPPERVDAIVEGLRLRIERLGRILE